MRNNLNINYAKNMKERNGNEYKGKKKVEEKVQI